MVDFRLLGVSVTFEVAVQRLEGVWGSVCVGCDVDGGIGTFRDAIILEIQVQGLAFLVNLAFGIL